MIGNGFLVAAARDRDDLPQGGGRFEIDLFMADAAAGDDLDRGNGVEKSPVDPDMPDDPAPGVSKQLLQLRRREVGVRPPPPKVRDLPPTATAFRTRRAHGLPR